MRKGIIYTRSRENSNMPPWKQLMLLFEYAKAIDLLDMGVISVIEDDNRHDRFSIEDLHTMLKRHDCHAVMVMDLQCLSDDPSQLGLILKRFSDDGITVFDLFASE